MEETTGRNAPCPCGSGKKYKACCLRADQERARADPPEVTEPKRASTSKAISWDDVEWDDDDLDELSNGALDLIREGRLDEAEHACDELLRRYPEVYDGLERMGMILEARGKRKEAADYFRRAVAHARSMGGVDEEYIQVMQRDADRLDPPG